MSYKDYREKSREPWGANQESNLSIEQLQCGAILRIADAVEKMVEPFAKLTKERDWYKKQSDECCDEIGRLARCIRSLKGKITKLKK